MKIYVDGVGLFGPGLNGWAHAREVLSGRAAHEFAALTLPPADALPPAERRRVGLALKLSMAAGFEAVRDAGADAKTLAAVFSSTGGDCDNCHQILETLATPERAVSPTRFHNSVHNMPAGYWSIATGCMAASTSLCAYDATFAAGLLEATTQALASGQPCLLVAFDTAYPEPLYAQRPIPYAFGAALALNPTRSAAAKATLALSLAETEVATMSEPELERLRLAVPAARSLPLMRKLANCESGAVVIDYLDDLQLVVDLQP